MLKRRFYYTVKPYLPWRLRMALRRISAERRRKATTAIWPIHAAAAQPPSNWRGWPEGKKFAFVLTHDVEGALGLARCRETAQLEAGLGFRSSFNFVPEGAYTVSTELREWLTTNGFEVGVHDLHHDGKLFTSREGFLQKAKRINQYVKDWGASGFRAGFMLRHLDWYHDLEVLYDASTFDTDPFEFQPDGAGTIFPFWIKNSSGSGYIELPYTLAQDSTLFLLLRESTPDIWQRKLDWIAQHGGMAMVIVHPDYMDFSNRGPSQRTYSSSLYSSLLQYVSQKYQGQYWHPLPRELAQWYQRVYPLSSQPAPAFAATNRAHEQPARGRALGLRGKRAAVLLYSNYPADPRPRRAAEALIDAGMEVDLFCLSENEGEKEQERVNGVQVFRLPMQRRRDSKRAYFWLYGRFLWSSFWFLARRGFRRKYDIVHVHNMPDILVFSSLLPKLLGAKVILDLHDPMPELMMTIYGSAPDSSQIKVLKRLEKWSIRFADAVVTVNQACKRLFAQRSCGESKVNVVMNSPNERIFEYRDAVMPAAPSPIGGSSFVIMYHGSLVERHGLDLAVAALAKIKPSIPGAELRVYGQNTPYLQAVLGAIDSPEVRAAVHYHGPKNLEHIVEAIRACDVGVIPNRRSIFTELNTPTRIFEYLSQGRPVVAPRAPGILDYFGADDLVYFELGDVEDLAKQLEYVHRERAAVAVTVQRGQRVYQNHCWSSERRRFEELVVNLLGADSADTEPVRDLALEANKSGR